MKMSTVLPLAAAALIGVAGVVLFVKSAPKTEESANVPKAAEPVPGLPAGWLTDIGEGIARAKSEGKAVMVEFTGSEWCPPCIVMRRSVFSKQEFFDAASEDFVLVVVDIPKVDKELAAKGWMTAGRYGVTDFPTVVLLDGEGKEFSRFFAADHPRLEDFLKHLKSKLP